MASLKDVEKLDYNNLETSELSEKLFVRYIAQGTLWKMGDMFQLSVELYDAKDKKVVWSDRWQEKWDNLPTIKMNLSDGLLKALDTTSKVGKEIETTSAEAYEYYLRGKHKYEKRENLKDIEIARSLLQKAIDLDSNLILAKISLGDTYSSIGDNKKAMDIYTSALQQAEELGDKRGIGDSLNNIGFAYYGTGDYENEKALDSFEKAFAIMEELGDKLGMGVSLAYIGMMHKSKGDLDTALDYFGKSLSIREELGDKYGIGDSLSNIGFVHKSKGDLDTALDCFGRSLSIREEVGDKHGIGGSLANIGMMHKNKGDLDTALDYYGRSLSIREELGDKYGIGDNLSNIGFVHENKGDLDTALDYFGRSLSIREELGDKYGIGGSLDSIGIVHKDKGDLDTALDYYGRSLAINEELSGKYGMGFNLLGIGIVHHNKGDYDKAEEYLDKSLAIQKETRFKLIEFATTTYLYLTYKHLGKDYDEKEIHTLIKEAENINFELNLRLYELLEDNSYLETAYKQVQEKASAMEEELSKKFLSYPIPKAIVEEWEKVK